MEIVQYQSSRVGQKIFFRNRGGFLRIGHAGVIKQGIGIEPGDLLSV
ncbi:hypothetical protein [Peribacillus aracenensis]|nr:hypothetical protein [Peribacillus sp. BBB004]